MKWSQFYLNTLKETPREAEAISHQLMVRAGLIRRLGSGAYSYLPFGWRALQKVIGIVREEMDAADAQELFMPALHPIDIWKSAGRDAVMGEVLFRFKDRSGKEMALGPTHEEVVTDLMRELKSYKQLPICVYQIQTKFRDEPRPRFGVIRSKEFIMKDAYSFDLDAEGLDAYYRKMYAAYERIFTRCGLTFYPCEADSGAMGGDSSHEFMAPSDYGEGMIVRCSACAYVATDEAVETKAVAVAEPSAYLPLEEHVTPKKHTVDEVAAFLSVTPEQIIKTLIYATDDGPVAVLVRGDHDVNEAKLQRVLQAKQLLLANTKTIETVTGGPIGFSGPVGLKEVRVVADHAVRGVVNGVVGGNKADLHLKNANPDRDYAVGGWFDLRFPVEGDACPRCGGGTLKLEPGIEVGHVFKLGTKYTKALKIAVQNPAGKQTTPIMGCYGIGVNRLLATVIEQGHDERGIIWPAALAPFQVVITPMAKNEPELLTVAEAVAAKLQDAGFEVLLDDREQSPGSKLKDADLIGIPVQIVVGKVWTQEKLLEIRSRKSGEAAKLPKEEVLDRVKSLLAEG